MSEPNAYTTRAVQVSGGRWAVAVFKNDNLLCWAVPGRATFPTRADALADYQRRHPDPARGKGLPPELAQLLKGIGL